MLAKMDDPRRESIANSSWQQPQRKNPIDNRMQEQDMGEEILGEGGATNTGLGGSSTTNTTGNARQNQLCILPEIAAGQGKNDGHFHLPCPLALCVIFTILVSFFRDNALFASKAKINVV